LNFDKVYASEFRWKRWFSKHSGGKSKNGTDDTADKTVQGTSELDVAADSPHNILSLFQESSKVHSLSIFPTHVSGKLLTRSFTVDGVLFTFFTFDNYGGVTHSSSGQETVSGEPVGGITSHQAGLSNSPAAEHGVAGTTVERVSGGKVGRCSCLINDKGLEPVRLGVSVTLLVDGPSLGPAVDTLAFGTFSDTETNGVLNILLSFQSNVSVQSSAIRVGHVSRSKLVPLGLADRSDDVVLLILQEGNKVVIAVEAFRHSNVTSAVSSVTSVLVRVIFGAWFKSGSNKVEHILGDSLGVGDRIEDFRALAIFVLNSFDDFFDNRLNGLFFGSLELIELVHLNCFNLNYKNP